MGVCRAADPACETRWREAHNRDARGREWLDVCALDRRPVARVPKDLPLKSTVYGYFDLWTYDGTLD
jgi:hypothetical protein